MFFLSRQESLLLWVRRSILLSKNNGRFMATRVPGLYRTTGKPGQYIYRMRNVPNGTPHVYGRRTPSGLVLAPVVPVMA